MVWLSAVLKILTFVLEPFWQENIVIGISSLHEKRKYTKTSQDWGGQLFVQL